MNCPNRYVALASIAPPKEVWWLNAYSSQADVDRIVQAYANNPALTSAMNELAQGKRGLTSEPIDMMAEYRPDLSDLSPWRIGEQRFAAVLEMREPAKAHGAVFQVPDGRAFAFAATANREEAERLALGLRPALRVFEVRPEWSFPDDVWVERNPELWKR